MSNPAFNNDVVHQFSDTEGTDGKVMTVSGAIGKTVVLFTVLVLVSFYTFSLVQLGFSDKAFIFMNVGLIGAFITALFVCFGVRSKYMVAGTIIYAILEGLAIGSLTGVFAKAYGGALIINAVCATFASLLATLFLYKTGAIKCTNKFKSTLIASTLGVCILYLGVFIMGLFNPAVIQFVYGSGAFAIGLNVLVCIVAVLNFILDFDTIENGANMNLPERFEWYCAFGLLVTLVWVYIEFLKLLSRFQKR